MIDLMSANDKPVITSIILLVFQLTVFLQLAQNKLEIGIIDIRVGGNPSKTC